MQEAAELQRQIAELPADAAVEQAALLAHSSSTITRGIHVEAVRCLPASTIDMLHTNTKSSRNCAADIERTAQPRTVAQILTVYCKDHCGHDVNSRYHAA